MIKTIAEINQILKKASQSYRSGMLFMLGNFVTFGLLGFFLESPVSLALDEVDSYLYVKNEKIFHPAGLHFYSLWDTALQHVLFSCNY
jgi:hypothetical protein